MEYVIVRLSDGAERDVYIDGNRSGRTHEVLLVETGTHTFALCPCAGDSHDADCDASLYRPVSQRRRVRNTLRIRPLGIFFERHED